MKSLSAFVLAVLLGSIAPLRAQTGLITYQGVLADAGAPANGNYELQFSIFTASTNGTQRGSTLIRSTVVSDGRFSVPLDFGLSVFDGTARWMEIGVRTNGAVTPFVRLDPRQAVAAAPYALHAQSAYSASTALGLAAGTVNATSFAPGAITTALQAEGQSTVGSGGVILSPALNASNLVSAGYVKLGRTQVSDESWKSLDPNPQPARDGHVAVWTGTEMIVWGGSGSTGVLDDGGRFNPALNTWTSIASPNAPSARSFATVVWTGTEMIVWGGFGDAGLLNDGGRYVARSNLWADLNTVGAPAARIGHTAVWTGAAMIVWGGQDFGGYRADGGIFHPDNNSWTPLPAVTDVAGRSSHTALWTGAEMIIWGGYSTNGFEGTGARYSTLYNAWTSLSAVGGPEGRALHAAVWTGTEMIVWGGSGGTGDLNSGGRWRPSTGQWTLTSLVGAPSGRVNATAVWTGNEMIIWGGGSGAGLATGGVYVPAGDAWTPITATLAATPRVGHSAVWTGLEMLIYGGISLGTPLDTLFSYTPARTLYLYLRP